MTSSLRPCQLRIETVCCGGILAPATAITTNTAVKTSEKPFQIHVRFDGSEVETGVTEVGATDIGFQIKYVQTAC